MTTLLSVKMLPSPPSASMTIDEEEEEEAEVEEDEEEEVEVDDDEEEDNDDKAVDFVKASTISVINGRVSGNDDDTGCGTREGE